MKKRILLFTQIALLTSIFFTSCTKEDDPIMPSISFKKEVGYISANTTAKYGDTLHFNITANSNGTNNLVKFQVFANDQQLVDSTINLPSFSFDFKSVKGASDKDVWRFKTTDIAGNSKTDSIIITGKFGEILTHNVILFGAQNNTTEKSFLSFSSGVATTYFQADAFNHQSEIDMFCFYENTAQNANMMTLAAPGSNITGIFTGSTSPDKYTSKNLTFFVKTTLTSTQFDAVANDAAILMSYDPKKQYKKAKQLTVGDVYAFKLQSGKYGLYKVIAVEGTETGTLKIAVKIQK